MGHGLTNTDNMIYVGETPWHGLGTKLSAPPTVEEALAAAGLDWTVRCERTSHMLRIPLPGGGFRMEPRDAKGQVVIREDTNEILGSVGPRWTPVQNCDALGWFDRWLETDRVELETAGSLFGGAKVWGLARIKSDPIVVTKGSGGVDDLVSKFILIGHAHDGTMAIRVGLTATRVVCNNTLSFAVRDGDGDGSLIKISHTTNALDRLEDAADMIEQLDARLSAAAEVYQELAKVEVVNADETIAAYVAGVYEQTLDKAKSGRRIAHISRLFEEGEGQDLPGARGTYWGLYNALTEYETHAAHRDHDRGKRAFSNAHGTGAKRLSRGLDVAYVMARKSYTIDEVLGQFSDAAMIADANHPDAIAV